MPEHVLVIDDDPDIAESLAMILEDEGFAVTVAANGADALRAIETTRPAVIVLDMLMPVMDGAQFASELARRDPDHAPIVVVSATHDVRDRAHEIGAEAFMMKPFDVRTLCRTLARLCEASPYVAPTSVSLDAVVRPMARRAIERQTQFVYLIERLGGAAAPRMPATHTGELHYLELGRIAPRLLADEQRLAKACRAMLGRLAGNRAAAELVSQGLAEHEANVSRLRPFVEMRPPQAGPAAGDSGTGPGKEA